MFEFVRHKRHNPPATSVIDEHISFNAIARKPGVKPNLLAHKPQRFFDNFANRSVDRPHSAIWPCLSWKSRWFHAQNIRKNQPIPVTTEFTMARLSLKWKSLFNSLELPQKHHFQYRLLPIRRRF